MPALLGPGLGKTLSAPAVGAVEGEWLQPWFEAWTSLGLLDPPQATIMPAPNAEGEPSLRPVRSKEIAAWANKLIEVYSRDNAARSLHILDAMLAEVRSGYFMPDCGRGSRFSTGYAAFNAFPQPGRCDTGENAAELPREEDHRDDAAGGEMPNEGEGHDTHIGEYATSASSSESEAEERRDSAGVNILPSSAPGGYRMLQNRCTKTIH